MRFFYYLTVLVFLIVSACSNPPREALPGEVIISGTVDNPISDMDIILERMGFNGVESVDTVKIDGNEFTFYVKEAEQAFYRVNLFDKQYVTFILSNDDKLIEVTADGSKATGSFSVTGSIVNDQKNAIDSVEKYFGAKFATLEQNAINARETNNTQEFEKIRLQYFDDLKQKNIKMKEAIWEATPNLSAIYGLNYLDANAEFNFMDSVATSFKSSGKLLGYAQSIIDRVENMRRLAVGSPAPEISLPNPNGEIVTLSSLKGKYVLIDFWAAWCRPCRMENPNVKRMYETYASEGFEILGVSIDRKREDWVRAIEKDGLPWKHVLDLQRTGDGPARIYEVETIPATYLIDPEGNILAKGLRGPTLRAKLKEIFG